MGELCCRVKKEGITHFLKFKGVVMAYHCNLILHKVALKVKDVHFATLGAQCEKLKKMLDILKSQTKFSYPFIKCQATGSVGFHD